MPHWAKTALIVVGFVLLVLIVEVKSGHKLSDTLSKIPGVGGLLAENK